MTGDFRLTLLRTKMPSGLGEPLWGVGYPPTGSCSAISRRIMRLFRSASLPASVLAIHVRILAFFDRDESCVVEPGEVLGEAGI